MASTLVVDNFQNSGGVVLSYPAANTTLVGTDTTQTLTNKTITAPVLSGTTTGTYTLGGTPTISSPTITSPTISGTPVMSASVLTSGTANTSLSGTAIDFTGIPSWVKRVTVMLSGVSTNGSNYFLMQIGSGSVTTSGYIGVTAITGTATGATTSTSGFILFQANPSSLMFGHVVFTLLTGNTWISTHTLGNNLSTGYSMQGGGNVTLSGALDRVRLTTVGGTDTFDAGSINVMYE
jgi:hypothetical protein